MITLFGRRNFNSAEGLLEALSVNANEIKRKIRFYDNYDSVTKTVPMITSEISAIFLGESRFRLFKIFETIGLKLVVF